MNVTPMLIFFFKLKENSLLPAGFSEDDHPCCDSCPPPRLLNVKGTGDLKVPRGSEPGHKEGMWAPLSCGLGLIDRIHLKTRE